MSHPEWDEIIDAKGSFGWQAVPVFKYDGPFLHRAYQYEGPYFVISANFKNLNESEVNIQQSANFQAHQAYLFPHHSTIDLGVDVSKDFVETVPTSQTKRIHRERVKA